MNIAMKLPSDYLDIVRRGAEVLQSLGADLRRQAERRPGSPELWLTVRDYEGLAARLASLDDWSWRKGFGRLKINGQDIGVLNELVEGGSGAPNRPSAADHRLLAGLKTFLDRYRDGEYEFHRPQPNER